MRTYQAKGAKDKQKQVGATSTRVRIPRQTTGAACTTKQTQRTTRGNERYNVESRKDNWKWRGAQLCSTYY